MGAARINTCSRGRDLVEIYVHIGMASASELRAVWAVYAKISLGIRALINYMWSRFSAEINERITFMSKCFIN